MGYEQGKLTIVNLPLGIPLPLFVLNFLVSCHSPLPSLPLEISLVPLPVQHCPTFNTKDASWVENTTKKVVEGKQ